MFPGDFVEPDVAVVGPALLRDALVWQMFSSSTS